MREVILLINATKSLNNRNSLVLRRFFSAIIIFLMVINIFLIFINRDDHIDSSTMVMNFINMLNISTTSIIAYGYIFRNYSEKTKNDFLKFVVQIPVSKKAVAISKFVHIWIGFIPVFIIIIVQNISCYIHALEGMGGYIGLCTILACCQLIILAFFSGCNPFLNPIKLFSKVFSFFSLSIVFLSIFIIFGSIGLNNEEIYYGMFGERAVGLFVKLEFFSGITGGVVVIISVVLAYLLSYSIPNKIFGKKGWVV